MENLIKNFNNHGFKTEFFKDRSELINYLLENVKDEFVSFGGSMTLKELNLYNLLNENNKVLWHWEKDDLRDARLADTYFLSANAITRDGKILNIDGSGNRVSMAIFGPKKCYYIVGKNKICDNITDAYERVKNVSCVLNAKRLNLDTPCVKLNKCIDCNHKDRICRAITIIERPTKMETYVLIVDENLGY